MFDLYDSIATQILNCMAALDNEAFLWTPRFTVPDEHLGIPDIGYQEIPVTFPWRTKSRHCDKARSIIKAMKRPPLIQQGYDGASYLPENDTVFLPDRTQFHSEEELYATVFHELVHSTGHESRLYRPRMQIVFNQSADPDLQNAEEEVLTELAAAFLCAHSGIIENTIRGSVAYIRDWAAVISPSNTACAVIDALPDAKRACAYILGQK